MRFLFLIYISVFVHSCATNHDFDKNIIENKDGKNKIIKEESEFCKKTVVDFDKYYHKIDSLRNTSNKLAYSCIKNANRSDEIEKYISEYKFIKSQFVEYKNNGLFKGYQLDKCFGSSFKSFFSTNYNSMSQSFSLAYEYCSKNVEDIFVKATSEQEYSKQLDEYFKINIDN